MVREQHVCLRRLSDGNHSQEIRFGRFLGHAAVTTSQIIASWSARTGAAVEGRHILALQDTSEIKFATTGEHRRGLGKVKKGNCHGLLLHPMLAVDADGGQCLGLVGGQIWTRGEEELVAHSKRRLSEKESRRWVETAQAAKPLLAPARMVTFIADRESDFYALWSSVPGGGPFHALARAMNDHAVSGGGTLAAMVRAKPFCDKREVELRERADRSSRKAELSLRFGEADIRRPRNNPEPGAPESVRLRWIEVMEEAPPEGEEAVRWLLLTSHEVTTSDEAWQIVGWYKQRWLIEQFFRTLKLQGFNIEESQLQSAERLEKLVAIAVKAAAIVLQLVQARGGGDQKADLVFSPDEIHTLAAIEKTYKGKSPANRNPHPKASLAWASWIIAKLGGWNGYAKAKPPGPITFYNGLRSFRAITQGWILRDMYTP